MAEVVSRFSFSRSEWKRATRKPFIVYSRAFEFVPTLLSSTTRCRCQSLSPFVACCCFRFYFDSGPRTSAHRMPSFISCKRFEHQPNPSDQHSRPYDLPSIQSARYVTVCAAPPLCARVSARYTIKTNTRLCARFVPTSINCLRAAFSYTVATCSAHAHIGPAAPTATAA